MMTEETLPSVLEAILFSAGKPLTIDQLLALFAETERPEPGVLRKALQTLQETYEPRSVNLVEVASGYRFQVHPNFAPWVGKLWEEKATRYSRALLETLALIAYRQPITRGEIEEIRGVTVSPSIIKTLAEEREWIRVVGHREVPGRPALYATTKLFLDYFGLKSLDQLPSLPDILSLETEQPPSPQISLENHETEKTDSTEVEAQNLQNQQNLDIESEREGAREPESAPESEFETELG